MNLSDMPPFAALRAFDAAARLGSFRDAAAEIGVTASAVSHQVKALEEWLGAPLFVRAVRAVRLTEEGRALARSVSSGFSVMQAALARAKSRARDTRLRVSALPLIANVWLAPRLAQFQSRFPDIAIDIDTSNRLADFESDTIDVAIRNIFAPTPGLSSRKLLDLQATPLCTPAVARTLSCPADLAKTALIHISARKAGWPEWLQAAGVKALKPKANFSFDTIPTALEAAANGRGVVLGLTPLVWDAPAAAALVAPFALSISAGTYFVVTRREDRHRPVVAAFVDWIVREMRLDARRLARLGKRA